MADEDGCKTYSAKVETQPLTSLQRFGNAITSSGVLNLKHSRFAEDFRPIEEDCTCTCCTSKAQGGIEVSRAYIYHLAAKETVGAHL